MIPKDNIGVSPTNAELMGKPHLGAFYRREDYRSHAMLEGARCAVCGRPATNVHHVVARSKAHGFTVDTPLGRFVALSPLFALCGSGTAGCHGRFHSLRYVVRWEWDDEDYKEAWWDGRTLARVCSPHDRVLFTMGRYVLVDTKTGEERTLK